MKKKEVEVEDRTEQLKQLREMSLLSLSHTPSSELDEVIKIIKNFFGVYFEIKDEFTYSELLERAAEFGLDDSNLRKINEYVKKLQKILYVKEKTTASDMDYIKDEITDIIQNLIPTGQEPPAAKAKKPGILNSIMTKKNKRLESLPEPEVKQATNVVKKPEKKQAAKPLLKKEKPKKKKDKGLEKIETQIAALEKQLSSVDNPFIKLELESLKGDIGLYKADPASIDPQTLTQKIDTLKGRLS